MTDLEKIIAAGYKEEDFYIYPNLLFMAWSDVINGKYVSFQEVGENSFCTYYACRAEKGEKCKRKSSKKQGLPHLNRFDRYLRENFVEWRSVNFPLKLN